MITTLLAAVLALAPDPAVLDGGHADLGPHYADGEWSLMVLDDAAEPPRWLAPADTVVQVGDAALLTVPDDPAYAFLPADPGANVHVIPQTQNPDLVWLGWNTQDPEVLETIGDGVTLTLRGVEGPGELVVFLQSGTLGDPEVLWDSRDDAPQDLWVEANTHTHANWVFSTPGAYLVELEVSATLADGAEVTDTEQLRFAVGDGTDVSEEPAPAEQEAAAVVDPPAEEEDAGPPVSVAVVAGGAAVLLLAVVVVVALRGRAAKRRAEAGA